MVNFAKGSQFAQRIDRFPRPQPDFGIAIAMWLAVWYEDGVKNISLHFVDVTEIRKSGIDAPTNKSSFGCNV